MYRKRVIAVIAVASAAALALAGCSGSGSKNTTSQGSGIAANTKLTIAQNSAFTSPNGYTATGNSTYNQNVVYMTNALGFYYYDNTPKLVKNTKFGTYTKLSDSPLSVKYTVNKGVTWTDGLQVGYADALLNWASEQTKYNSSAKGGINFTNPEAGAGTGSSLITKLPVASDDNRTWTISYDKPYIDWELQPQVNMSAAATWELAGINADTGKKAQQDVIDAITSGNTTQIAKLATAYATGFDASSMPTNKAVLTSNGPYQITNIVKNQYVTLTARKNFIGGPAPKLSQITVREIPDQTAQVQGLQNGEINILYGQATSDTVKALKGAKGITSTTTPTSDYEHIDLTLNNKGPFDPATYGGNAAKALAVRQAFLHIIPRDEIIDRIVKPLSPNIKADNSSTFIPGSAGYDASVAANGSSAYGSTDVGAAKALLTKAGVKTPVNVKFAYANDNPRRQGEFQLLQAAAKSSGLFTVQDVGKPTADFFGASGLGSGKYNYDATVFAWSYTSLALTGAQGQFITGGASNFQGYNSKAVNEDFAKIATSTSTAEATPLLQDVDKQYLADAAALTLFQLPSVTAWTSSVKNVSDAPLVPNVFWNFWQWENSK